MSTQQIVSALMGIPWKDNNLKAKKTQEYLDWIKAASRGGRFTYHIGLSPQETFISSAMAALVHRDYEDGFVFPVSVRKAPHIFEFMAIRSSKQF